MNKAKILKRIKQLEDIACKKGWGKTYLWNISHYLTDKQFEEWWDLNNKLEK